MILREQVKLFILVFPILASPCAGYSAKPYAWPALEGRLYFGIQLFTLSGHLRIGGIDTTVRVEELFSETVASSNGDSIWMSTQFGGLGYFVEYRHKSGLAAVLSAHSVSGGSNSSRMSVAQMCTDYSYFAPRIMLSYYLEEFLSLSTGYTVAFWRFSQKVEAVNYHKVISGDVELSGAVGIPLWGFGFHLPMSEDGTTVLSFTGTHSFERIRQVDIEDIIDGTADSGDGTVYAALELRISFGF